MYPKRLILDDARSLGITVLGIDVNRSGDTYRLERLPEDMTASLRRSAPEDCPDGRGTARSRTALQLAFPAVIPRSRVLRPTARLRTTAPWPAVRPRSRATCPAARSRSRVAAPSGRRSHTRACTASAAR